MLCEWALTESPRIEAVFITEGDSQQADAQELGDGSEGRCKSSIGGKDEREIRKDEECERRNAEESLSNIEERAKEFSKFDYSSDNVITLKTRNGQQDSESQN
jgi:hypothetical protein